MRVIFPFTYFDEYYALRYREQLMAIADHVELLTLFITIGKETTLEHENIKCVYDRIQPPSWEPNPLYVNNMKDNFAKYSFYNYWGKLPLINRLSKDTKCLDGDIVLGMSGAGWQQVFHNLIGDRKGIPVVHRMRGNGRVERKLNNNIVNRIFNDTLENISYRMYDHFIPISKDFKKILIDRGVSKNKISNPIGLGVNTDIFSPSLEEGEYVGYFGRMSPEKGSDFLLKLMWKTPFVKYLIAGSNNGEVVFPSNVTYMGQVDKTSMSDLINQCRMILMPSRSEGVANGILEAYACGKPVLGSVNAFADSLPIYLPPLELYLPLWVEAVRDAETQCFRSISKQARRWACEHSWDKFGKKMTNELRTVIE